jgi:NTE family protein
MFPIRRWPPTWIANAKCGSPRARCSMRSAPPSPSRRCSVRTHDGRRLVDGALLNPLPVTPLIRDHADYLVAVSIDGPAENASPIEIRAPEKPRSRGIGRLLEKLRPGNGDSKNDPEKPTEPGAIALLNQSMDLMQANLSRLRLAAYQPDLLVQMARNVSSVYEFYRARELIELGRERTRAAVEAWQRTPR